nr:hypothetical protein [Tanacetum cinerariifolium]
MYASSTKKYPQKHIVPVAVLTKSKPVFVTAARPVSAVVPKIMTTKPRHARSLHTKSNLIIKRNKTHSQFSKTSNSSPKVTTAQAQVVSATKGKKGKWVSDSEDESEPNDPWSTPSFVQTSEHVKLSRDSAQPVEASILDDTPNSTSSKTNVLTKSKPVFVTAARPVSAAVPKIMATKPRHARSLHTKSNLIIKRHKTHSQFSKTSNSSPKVTAAQAQV